MTDQQSNRRKGIKRISFGEKQRNGMPETQAIVYNIRRSYSPQIIRNARYFGIGLMLWVTGVYYFSINHMGQEDFSNIDLPPPSIANVEEDAADEF